MSEAIVKVEPQSVAATWRNSTDVAGAVRDFAIKRAVSIQGKKYCPVEVWQAIANAYGCVASSRDVERVEGGIRAIGEVRRMSDGAVIGQAEGFVGDDETTWAKRLQFARRAMAQTRAISRACRSAFAFVVPLIDVNLQTTPAEEMEAVLEPQQAPPVSGKKTTADAIKQQLASRVAKESAKQMLEDAGFEVVDQPQSPPKEPEQNSLVFDFGKYKGHPVSSADTKYLRWLAEESKPDFRARYAEVMTAVEEELEARAE